MQNTPGKRRQCRRDKGCHYCLANAALARIVHQWRNSVAIEQLNRVPKLWHLSPKCPSVTLGPHFRIAHVTRR